MDRIEAFRVFLAVAEHGSFSEASRRLGVSPGQVSKQVAALEARLKRRLFERSTRAVRLTPEGETLIESAQTLVDSLDTIEAGLSPENDEISGMIRLTAPVIYGANRVAPILADVLAEHERLSVRLSLSDRKTDMVEEGFDLAVRIGEQTDLALIGKKVRTEAMKVVASPAYLERAGRPQNPSELQAHECLIDLNVAQPKRWAFNQGDQDVAVRVDGRFESDSAEAIRAAAVSGVGIALTPGWCLGDSLENGDLVELFPDWTISPPEVWLVWPPGRYLPRRVRLVIDALAEGLAS